MFRTRELAIYGDHTFGALTPARTRSSPSDAELDLYSTPENLENPRRPSAAILKLQDPFLKCSRNLGWNIDWAVAFIADHLAAADAADSFRAIRRRAADLESDGLLQEIPYCIFNKLDEVLFAGHLRNAVYLDIRDLGLDVSGTTSNHGWGPDKNIKRILIAINSIILEYGSARDVVATLIHHMVHAYFLVACGLQKEEEVDYGRLGHGVHFGKILLAIKNLSATCGKELSALKFSFRSRRPHYLAADFYGPYDRATVRCDQSGEWYCSHCNDQVQELSESEVDRWYKRVCKPMRDQHPSVQSPEVYIYNDRSNELELKHRAQLPPSTKSIEFIYKDTFVQVQSTKLDDLYSVRKAFDRAESRYLKIDKSTSETTFMRYLEFVHTHSYRPDPAPLAALSSSVGMGRRGPPIIKSQSSSTDSPILSDVEFARFANSMKFDECHQYALSRMNAYDILYEDPVKLLKAIYHGNEPDPDLKAWARKFLVQTPTTTLPGSNFGGPQPPNLLKLERDSGSYRTRFFEAIDCSGALENDVNKACAELKALGWYNWPSLIPSSIELLGTSNGSYPHTALTLGHVRSPPLLTDLYTSPFRTETISNLGTPSFYTADMGRLGEYECLKELQSSREGGRSRTKTEG
ncbi:hypothetical protein J1614_003083 [Plenodomus biglobosus]|nr:hypothetical protein J1614_003083 [Plenodomus biglobosus]